MQLPQTAGVLVPLGIGAVVVIIALVVLIVRARRKRRRAADVTGTGVDLGSDPRSDPRSDAAQADAAEPTPSDWTGEALYAPPPQRSSGAHPVTVAEAMAGWKTEKSPAPAEQEMPPELDALLSPTTPMASPASGARVPVQREPST
ncbi:MAG: hypothetical protein ACRD0H_04545, partial [Actinomycetes bacterium]